MYAWSSDCCVGQAGRKGLVNLFGTLGWQGTCRQGKVPAQSYVSNCLSVLEYRSHYNTRDMEGKARRVQGYGFGYGYGYGPGARAGTTTRGTGTGTGGLCTGTGTGTVGLGLWDWGGMGSRKKVGSRFGGVGVEGCMREGVCVCVAVGVGSSKLAGGLLPVEEEEDEEAGEKTRVGLTIETGSEHSGCSAWPQYDDVQPALVVLYLQVEAAGRWEG